MRHVGNDIRTLRKSSGKTLKDLADSLNRSVGWLSQVERGHATPSVADLGKIAEELGISISFFFRGSRRNEHERGLIQRSADHFTIGSAETGLLEELISPHLGGNFEIIRSTFLPGYSGIGQKVSPDIEHGGVVISGELDLTIGDLSTTLAQGDGFQFQNKEYSWKNKGDVPAVVLWIVSPPAY